jgi:hypothetical protein
MGRLKADPTYNDGPHTGRSMSTTGIRKKSEEYSDDRLAPTAETEVQAWEQLEAGRYMPRRVRGSDRGRELG